MPSSACLPLFNPLPLTLNTNQNPKPCSFYNSTAKSCRKSSIACRASSSSSGSAITDFDLYDLLGIDSSSDQSQIKMAYRSLQKKCHPDIAGPAGHDMAIILNETYALLSDPSSRLAYDKEQAKTAELRGYTGKPLYSAWFGSEYEERAVFVDEVKCVGCLKCALFAEKTFAIESVYGRARVVGQWADPEHKIMEAIETCPVDCISIVERSNLAALEFLMSKQPRGNVRMSAGNAVGKSVSNIFVEMVKFQKKYRETRDKASAGDSEEVDIQRRTRITAIQAIRAISNWLYWQTPKASSEGFLVLVPEARKWSEPDIDKIRNAAKARKLAKEKTGSTVRTPPNYSLREEYWVPSALPLPTMSSDSTTATNIRSASQVSTTIREEGMDMNKRYRATTVKNKKKPSFVSLEVPIAIGMIAAAVVKLNAGEVAEVGRINEHMGGSLALEIVNSSWLQILLAGTTWYCIGLIVLEVVGALWSRDEDDTEK